MNTFATRPLSLISSASWAEWVMGLYGAVSCAFHSICVGALAWK